MEIFLKEMELPGCIMGAKGLMCVLPVWQGEGSSSSESRTSGSLGPWQEGEWRSADGGHLQEPGLTVYPWRTATPLLKTTSVGEQDHVGKRPCRTGRYAGKFGTLA